MPNGNLQEWGEYDARLLDDPPLGRGAPEAESEMRFQRTSAAGNGQSDSPFLLAGEGESETETEIMQGERQGRRSFHRPPRPRPPRRTAAPSGCSCNCDSTDDTAAADAAGPDDGQSSESEAWASEATVSEQELAGLYPRSAGFESGEVKPSSAGCPTDRPHVVTGFSQYGYDVRLLPSDQLDKLRAIGQEIKQTAFSGRPGSESERTQVVVVGHADMDAAREIREPGFLQYISERRAIAVYDFLLCYLRRKVGVDDSMRVGWKVVGNGARSLAVAKPRTQSERGCNRRVEIVIQRPFEAVPKSSDSASQWRVVEWPILTDLYETALQGTSGQYTKSYSAVQNAKEISEKAWAAYSRWLDRDCGIEKTGQFVPPIITAGENQDFLRTFKDALQGTASKSSNSNEVVANAFEIAIHSLDLVRQQLRERMEWRHASLPQAMDADCEPGARVPGGPANHVVCRTHDHILDTTSRTVIAHNLEEYKRSQPTSAPKKSSREFEADLQTEAMNYGGQLERQFAQGEMEGTIADARMPAIAYEKDPYGIRATFASEQASLTADEIAIVAGRPSALLTLHRIFGSPEPRQAAMAVLLGRAGKRSARLNGSDIAIPVYLRLISRLSREAAEESEAQVATAALDRQAGKDSCGLRTVELPSPGTRSNGVVLKAGPLTEDGIINVQNVGQCELFIHSFDAAGRLLDKSNPLTLDPGDLKARFIPPRGTAKIVVVSANDCGNRSALQYDPCASIV